MSRFLADKGWLGSDRTAAASLDPVVMAYFTTCLKPSLALNPESAHQIKILAEALDLLLKGDSVGGAELLMQRFKALEAHSQGRPPEECRQYELVRQEPVSCISPREQELARQSALTERKLLALPAYRG